MDTKTERIRALNDELRDTLTGGVGAYHARGRSAGIDAVNRPTRQAFILPLWRTRSVQLE